MNRTNGVNKCYSPPKKHRLNTNLQELFASIKRYFQINPTIDSLAFPELPIMQGIARDRLGLIKKLSSNLSHLKYKK